MPPLSSPPAMNVNVHAVRASAIACLLALSSIAAATRQASDAQGETARINRTMVRAAGAFMEGLSAEQQEKASAPWDEPERRTWQFGPVRREGIVLSDLSPASFERLEALLDTALSPRGMEAWREIRVLEEVLRERESRPGRPATHRDPDLYWLRVYGTPAADTDWSWRFEGHHIALHVTCRQGALPTVTPFFIGASPLLDARDRDVTVGAFARLRSAADDLLDAIGEEAGDMSPGERPSDIRMGPGKWDLPPRDGLDVNGFGERQLAAARALLDCYLELLDEPLRQHALRPAEEDVSFAHWGATSVRGERAWALVTESFALELATTTGKSHVHALLRDAGRDFGGEAK